MCITRDCQFDSRLSLSCEFPSLGFNFTGTALGTGAGVFDSCFCVIGSTRLAGADTTGATGEATCFSAITG
jgi:hypothetical protein